MAEKYLVITPKNIDEMGEIAHFIGNTHTPIKIAEERVYVQHKSNLEEAIKEKKWSYIVENKDLDLKNDEHHHHHHSHEH